jgi:hypothetical protein
MVRSASVVLALLLAAATAAGQELDLQNGTTTERDGSRPHTWMYALGYREALGEHSAWSVTYLDEGRVSVHKRDGFALQLWGREQLVARRLSVAAGVGPYIYWDTHLAAPVNTTIYADEHGVGTIASAAVTFYPCNRLFLRAQGNWVTAARMGTSAMASLGLGVRLEPSRPSEPESEVGRGDWLLPGSEIAVLGGWGTLNSAVHSDAFAWSAEYRRGLTRSFEATVGWLDEGSQVARAGLLAQLWAVRSFFADRLALGIGLGPYLARDHVADLGTTRLDWLVSLTGRARVAPHWTVRWTFHRATTSYSRDADSLLIGVGYLF